MIKLHKCQSHDSEEPQLHIGKLRDVYELWNRVEIKQRKKKCFLPFHALSEGSVYPEGKSRSYSFRYDSQEDDHSRIGSGHQMIDVHHGNAQKCRGLVRLPHLPEYRIPLKVTVRHYDLVFLVHGIVHEYKLDRSKNAEYNQKSEY